VPWVSPIAIRTEAVPAVQIDALRQEGLQDLLVKIFAAAGGDETICQAMVLQQLSTALVER